MSETKELRHLLAFTRGTISVLMAIGFCIDGCHASDPLFFIATLMWIYQPYVIRTESNVLHVLQHPTSLLSTK